IWAWNRTKFLQHLPVRTREELWTRAAREKGGAYRTLGLLIVWVFVGPVVSLILHSYLEYAGLGMMSEAVGHIIFWVPLAVALGMLERR
ncbi:hypothetical protein R0J87_21300, partial [Halomonas sp. SIMBA_159]